MGQAGVKRVQDLTAFPRPAGIALLDKPRCATMRASAAWAGRRGLGGGPSRPHASWPGGDRGVEGRALPARELQPPARRETTAELTTASIAAEAETAEARAARESREARERAEAAERARAEERARQEAADRAAREAEQARLAALLGEDAPTKGPAVVVQEGPAKKAPAVQEGAATKEAPPTVRLTADPGS
jgi:hypothetical protein